MFQHSEIDVGLSVAVVSGDRNLEGLACEAEIANAHGHGTDVVPGQGGLMLLIAYNLSKGYMKT